MNVTMEEKKNGIYIERIIKVRDIPLKLALSEFLVLDSSSLLFSSPNPIRFSLVRVVSF